jgi:hypothetical protein
MIADTWFEVETGLTFDREGFTKCWGRLSNLSASLTRPLYSYVQSMDRLFVAKLKGTVNWCLFTASLTFALMQLWQIGSVVGEEGERCGRARVLPWALQLSHCPEDLDHVAPF